MKSKLSDVDKANPEIATEPDVRDYDVLDIVPAVAPTATAVEEYPVQITFPAAGLSVTVQDGNLQPIMTANPAYQVWSIKLRRGLYRVVVAGGSEKTFSVTGPGSDAAGIVHVAA
jgi:hypothetical protein